MSTDTGPNVGIWWLHRGLLIAFSRPVAFVQPEAGYADYPYGHTLLWPFVQRRHPELRGREYWSLPRGRVLWSAAENCFMVLVPSAIIGNPARVSRLRNRYRLPPQQVHVLADEHYDMPAELRDDD